MHIALRYCYVAEDRNVCKISVVEETCSRARKTALDMDLNSAVEPKRWQSATANDGAPACPFNVYK